MEVSFQIFGKPVTYIVASNENRFEFSERFTRCHVYTGRVEITFFPFREQAYSSIESQCRIIVHPNDTELYSRTYNKILFSRIRRINDETVNYSLLSSRMSLRFPCISCESSVLCRRCAYFLLHVVSLTTVVFYRTMRYIDILPFHRNPIDLLLLSFIPVYITVLFSIAFF